ncbi:MAG: hypothetical protein R2710_13965 [Acidimicrobiales bacterium]
MTECSGEQPKIVVDPGERLRRGADPPLYEIIEQVAEDREGLGECSSVG